MARVVRIHPAGAGDRTLDHPRDNALVAEEALGGGRFAATGGPFRRYLRTVEARPDGATVETVDFAVSAPFWGLLFVPGLRRGLLRPPGAPPWWAPPERLDERAGRMLGLLCSLSLVGGYLGTVITQTATYASEEFGASVADQTNLLSFVRIGVVLVVVLASFADRIGRRPMATLTAGAGCLLTATGAFAPSLFGLGVSQILARGFAGALLVLIGILAAEEMPAGSRAWAVSLLAMTQALGAGMCVWLLTLVDRSETAWRLLYAAPLLYLPLVLAVRRALPESRRFARTHASAPFTGHGRRFWLLAVAGFLLAVFFTPLSQLSNEFLKEVRGFSGSKVALFTVVTATPGAIGVIVGGRLADTRGRRLVGVVAIVGGVSLSILAFSSEGWQLWALAAAASIVSGATVPALGVYRPELFPTSLRGRAGGTLEAIQVAGSVAGLQLVGRVVDGGESFGTGYAIAGIGPLVVVLLVLLAFPETAHRSLEELNPEDEAQVPPRDTA